MELLNLNKGEQLMITEEITDKDLISSLKDRVNHLQQTLDTLWEFISEKDINAIMQKLKEKNL